MYKSLPKDLSEEGTASLKQDVCTACYDTLELNKKVLGQRIEQADRDMLRQAVQQGMGIFQAIVEVLTDCSDPGAAKMICTVSLDKLCAAASCLPTCF